MSSRRLQALVVALALSVALPVAAAPPSGRKAEAAAHFQRGRTLYAQGSYADALAAFQSGFEALPLRGFLVNIGQCQRRLGRLDDAAASYAKFLDSTRSDPRLPAGGGGALTEPGTHVRAKERAPAGSQSPPSTAPRAAPTPTPCR